MWKEIRENLGFSCDRVRWPGPNQTHGCFDVLSDCLIIWSLTATPTTFHIIGRVLEASLP